MKCQKHVYSKLFSFVNKVKWLLVLLCITNNLVKHQLFIYTQLIVKTVLFQKIKLGKGHSLGLFDPKIGPYQVLPLRDRVNLGAMVMKGYSVMPKSLALLQSHHQINAISWTPMGVSYSSVEKYSVYSTAPAD